MRSATAYSPLVGVPANDSTGLGCDGATGSHGVRFTTADRSRKREARRAHGVIEKHFPGLERFRPVPTHASRDRPYPGADRRLSDAASRCPTTTGQAVRL